MNLFTKSKFFKISALFLLLCPLCFLSCTNVRAKNIILMVPDGMGLADVTAARIQKHGRTSHLLSFETLDHIGYQKTHSADNFVTDSAAAASAWACGEKFVNGEVCYHREGRLPQPSILELAKKSGRATGMAVTDVITGATPASFGAHVPSRKCSKEIARQFIEKGKVDVLLGGGRAEFTSNVSDPCGTGGNILTAALEEGYTAVHNREDMEKAISEGAMKLLGLFSDSTLMPEYRRASGTGEPRLPEMTAAALKVLEKHGKGFFLLVEGSLIDKANHRNDFTFQSGEVLAFDEAVSVVRAWIEADPNRRKETLLIVVPDHETGGFAIVSRKSAEEKNAAVKLETSWTGKGHTGVDTMIWSAGPGSESLGRAIDNTDLYRVMAEALK